MLVLVFVIIVIVVVMMMVMLVLVLVFILVVVMMMVLVRVVVLVVVMMVLVRQLLQLMGQGVGPLDGLQDLRAGQRVPGRRDDDGVGVLRAQQRHGLLDGLELHVAGAA